MVLRSNSQIINTTLYEVVDSWVSIISMFLDQFITHSTSGSPSFPHKSPCQYPSPSARDVLADKASEAQPSTSLLIHIQVLSWIVYIKYVALAPKGCNYWYLIPCLALKCLLLWDEAKTDWDLGLSGFPRRQE